MEVRPSAMGWGAGGKGRREGHLRQARSAP